MKKNFAIYQTEQEYNENVNNHESPNVTLVVESNSVKMLPKYPIYFTSEEGGGDNRTVLASDEGIALFNLFKNNAFIEVGAYAYMYNVSGKLKMPFYVDELLYDLTDFMVSVSDVNQITSIRNDLDSYHVLDIDSDGSMKMYNDMA
jgi:hypothetical protein